MAHGKELRSSDGPCRKNERPRQASLSQGGACAVASGEVNLHDLPRPLLAGWRTAPFFGLPDFVAPDRAVWGFAAAAGFFVTDFLVVEAHQRFLSFPGRIAPGPPGAARHVAVIVR